MSGEDQERFEDYLELEQYIEQLQAGHVAHPPRELTPAQARIYRMAALFRSASPQADSPRPEFAAELKARLEQEMQQQQKTQPFPFLSRKSARDSQTKRPVVSRRGLLAGGAAVAASLVVGAGIERVAEKIANNNGQGPAVSDRYGQLVANGQGNWHLVTTLAALGESAIRFTTDTIVGYVIRNDGDGDTSDPVEDPVVAVSAACTHMGCIVQWANADRKFHCPCHGGLFSEYGQVDKNSPIPYIRALPRLRTKIENGNVFVEVPNSTNSPQSTNSSWKRTGDSSVESSSS